MDRGEWEYLFQVSYRVVSSRTWLPSGASGAGVILPRQTSFTFLAHTLALLLYFSQTIHRSTNSASLLTMSQNILPDRDPVVESPRPLLPDRQESVHPGLHPSITNVPVTPGIHLGEYDYSEPRGPDEPSYFVHDIHKLRETMAQSPSAAASGAKSNHEILRRMSLSLNSVEQRRESLADIDPRAANPSLNLSGGIISATFCIPHSLKYRKGQDWVSLSVVGSRISANKTRLWILDVAHLPYLTPSHTSLLIARLGITHWWDGLGRSMLKTK